MKEPITPYKNTDEGKKEQVTRMFDNISGNYDRMNRVITFGMDLKWRRNVLQIISEHNPDTILDIATGTGDMAILFTKTSASKIVGLDLSPGMLEIAKQKVATKQMEDKIELELGDAEDLPFDSDCFDVVTVSYGIRNFENLQTGLKEIIRVLKKNGLLVILETSVPAKFPFKQGFNFYNKYILPIIGKLFSKDKKAYGYLSESSRVFPYGEELRAILEEIGFKNVQILPQAQGISSIYVGAKDH